jgi:predicted HTH domain antitoxin
MSEVLSVRYSPEELKRIDEIAKIMNTDISHTVRLLNSRGLKLIATELYAEGKISLEKAARLSDLSIWEMIELLRKMGIGSNIDGELARKGLKNLGIKVGK